MMKNLTKAILLSLSTGIALPAFAAPQGQPQPHDQMQHHQQSHAQSMHKQPQPHRDWKAGQKVPTDYRGSHYRVNYSQNKRLSRPGKHQEWIRVNGDYILINSLTHSILRIIHN